MVDKELLRNSSLFVAYMGCLGWGGAYFYGWGGAFYYGFPWWVVGAGVDDVARSLFYAVTAIVIFLVGWIIGVRMIINLCDVIFPYQQPFLIRGRGGWPHKPVQYFPGKNPCETSVDMLRQIIITSGRQGNLVAHFCWALGGCCEAGR